MILVLALAVMALPAHAQDFVADITRQLRQQGFQQIEVQRTWLGRSRILAENAEGAREIIVNPTTGEILRDLWQPSAGNFSERQLLRETVSGGRGEGADDNSDSGSDGGSGGNNGSGNSGASNDSGSDGGGSGHGGGDSGNRGDGGGDSGSGHGGGSDD